MESINSSIYQFNQVIFNFSEKTFLMGILNVTPDSFSDGGKFNSVDQGVDYALKMVDEGADIIDVGGESTRPGSTAISLQDEIERVVPVIKKLSKLTQAPLSIDTYKSEVARQSLEAGAHIVNDISGLHFDLAMADVIAEYGAGVIAMHIKGTPKTMQIEPDYKNLIDEIKQYLAESVERATQKGIKQIIIDPGIGFGKTVEHNLEIIRKLKDFLSIGYPVMVGPSRKSFIGKILNVEVVDRLEGTAAAVAASVINGANIVRVHDVKAMKRVIKMIDAIIKN